MESLYLCIYGVDSFPQLLLSLLLVSEFSLCLLSVC